MPHPRTRFPAFLAMTCILLFGEAMSGRAAPKDATYPPTLPDGRTYVRDKSEDFLRPAASLQKGIGIAKTPPTVELLYYPGQTYPGKPWSAWGDSLAVNGKYYASVGDHLAPGGNAFVYEF